VFVGSSPTTEASRLCMLIGNAARKIKHRRMGATPDA
jgi:hypothetical protein